MGRPAVNLLGRVFGRLEVAERAGSNAKGQALWKCRCTCGNVKVVSAKHLVSGSSKSCGCLLAEYLVSDKGLTKHGHAKTSRSKPSRAYVSWCQMHVRCTDVTGKDYARYGGRGIRVCARWKSFENFLADMGERPHAKSLDRINNMRGYSPANCRWATAQEQAVNRRSSRG